MNNTDISLYWSVAPQVSLHVVLTGRALSAQELHHLAEVVDQVESFRADVQGLEEAVQ
jgi:hypothetical protein